MRRCPILGLAIFLSIAGRVYGAPSTTQVAELPRPKPLEVSQAIETFKLHSGLRIEAAASEPLVGSPIDIDFDEDGRMYVVEMRDYPDRRE